MADDGGQAISLEEARRRRQRSRQPPRSPPTDGRPVIRIVAGELPRIVDEAEAALLAGGFGLYQRGGFIVRPALAQVAISNGREGFVWRLVSVRTAHVAECLTRAAAWERYDGRLKYWVAVDCPERVAETYVAREGLWRLPTLLGIINAPTLRPDGSVLDRPGYDAATGLLFEPEGVEFPPIPAEPTRDEAAAALRVLTALLAEFPFAKGLNDDTGANRSVALSGILTALVRPALRSAPLHGFSAPVAGSGKSYLVDIASMIAIGRAAGVIAQGTKEEEFEKRLAAALIGGDSIVAIDNCEQPLGGELLCQALTQPIVKPRVLGKSQNVEVPSNATFFATGNNLALDGDMTRRALLCSLDPDCEQPELREFRARPLEMISTDRPRYVAAGLTVLRAYQAAQMPKVGTAPLGSFETWSRWVRDALVWLGEADPCETMRTVRATDAKLGQLVAVMAAWDAAIGERRVSVGDIIEAATHREQDMYGSGEFSHPELRDALLTVAGSGGAINPRRLGKWLAASKGRVAGLGDEKRRWKINACPLSGGYSQWELAIVGGG